MWEPSQRLTCMHCVPGGKYTPDALSALSPHAPQGLICETICGRLFFIDWKPYPWSIVFQGLPFHYNYRKVLKMTTKSGQPLICPSKNDPTSYLSGHITSNHPLTKEADGWDFVSIKRGHTNCWDSIWSRGTSVSVPIRVLSRHFFEFLTSVSPTGHIKFV